MPVLPDEAFLRLAPDCVCEVLSPSTAALDRVKKLGVSAREAVAHVWLVDPAARTLDVLRLESAHWTLVGTRAGTDTVRAEPFEALDLDLTRLWDHEST